MQQSPRSSSSSMAGRTFSYVKGADEGCDVFHSRRFQCSRPLPFGLFVQCLKKVPDPRSQRGVSQSFHTTPAIVFFGLLANVIPPASAVRGGSEAPLRQNTRELHKTLEQMSIEKPVKKGEINVFFRRKTKRSRSHIRRRGRESAQSRRRKYFYPCGYELRNPCRFFREFVFVEQDIFEDRHDRSVRNRQESRPVWER